MDDAVMREDGPLQKPTVIPTPKVEMEVAKVEEMANAMAWALARIQALEADNARLRDALRPFADAGNYSLTEPVYRFFWEGFRLEVTNSGQTRGFRLNDHGEWLKVDHLRAAHLALHPDDTGGEDE